MSEENKLQEKIDMVAEWTLSNLEKAPLSDKAKDGIKDFIDSIT